MKVIYIHISTIGEFNKILNELLNKIVKSGLYYECDQVILSVNGDIGLLKVDDPKPKYKLYHTRNDATEYEFSTISMIRSHCLEHPGIDFQVLYLHTKGVTRQNEQNIRDWVEYMSYFNIEEWSKRAEELKTHDTTGVNLCGNPDDFINYEPHEWGHTNSAGYTPASLHYSGNFWWANSSHIRKLPDPYSYVKEREYKKYYIVCEMWLCQLREGKYFNAYTSGVNHYGSYYPRHRYIKKREGILFVTTTLNTKWLDYQRQIIQKLFPESEHLIIDGTTGWPNVWFDWIHIAKESDKEYYIHIDEDFFITDKEELLNALRMLEDDECDLLGCSDGLHHYRSNNPVAINTFLMFGKVEHLQNVDFSGIQFKWTGDSYENNFNLHFNSQYLKGFCYPHDVFEGFKFNNFEPYYAFLWLMKEKGLRFKYLYPHFDMRFRSTDPRIDKNSPDIGIHMWYTRQWNSNMEVWGMSNINRYNKIEEYLNDTLHIYNTSKKY